MSFKIVDRGSRNPTEVGRVAIEHGVVVARIKVCGED